jgi:hypothetical protein
MYLLHRYVDKFGHFYPNGEISPDLVTLVETVSGCCILVSSLPNLFFPSSSPQKQDDYFLPIVSILTKDLIILKA